MGMMFVFIVLERYMEESPKAVFTTKALAEDYIKNQKDYYIVPVPLNPEAE